MTTGVLKVNWKKLNHGLDWRGSCSLAERLPECIDVRDIWIHEGSDIVSMLLVCKVWKWKKSPRVCLVVTPAEIVSLYSVYVIGLLGKQKLGVKSFGVKWWTWGNDPRWNSCWLCFWRCLLIEVGCWKWFFVFVKI